jgi:putative ABC transport system permease protein
MLWLRLIYSRLYGLLRKNRIEQEMDDEMRFHLLMRTRENIWRGMRPDEAEREASRRFGNVGRIKDLARDIKGGGFMETLLQDLRYGARTLMKNPGFTLTAVITLALGIGATTVIFSAINSVLLRALPYEDPDKLMMVWATRESGSQIPVSPANMADWRKQNKVFEDIGGYSPQSYNLIGSGEPERLQGALVSYGLLTALRIKPIHGRIFSEDEDKIGASRVVIIGEKLWRRRFNADPQLVGRTVTLNGNNHTVIGILPTSLDLLRIAAPTGSALDDTELWTPLGAEAGLTSDRAYNILRVIARLKTNISVQQAQAEMGMIASQLETQYPEANRGRGIRIMPLYQEVIGRTSVALWILFGAVTFVMLIACANVANLMLIRGFRRHKEIAIRAALGAGTGRLIKQLLTESLILSLVGGSLGLLFASFGVRLVSSASPRSIIRLDQINLDTKALVFTFGASLLTGLIFGLMPAFQMTRVNMNESLKEGGRSNSDTRQHVRSLIVSFEVALALVLLIGAGLVVRSILGVLSVDPGFRTENILTMRVLLSQANYPDGQRRLNFFNEVTQRVRALPGVQSVGLINNLPLSGTGMSSGFIIEGRPAPTAEADYITGYRVIRPTYFDTMGIRLKKGRQFTERDNQNSPKVAIISEAMAQRFWQGEDPIGKRMAMGRDQAQGQEIIWREVVGVVGNVRHWGLMEDAPPDTYVSDLQNPSPSMFLVVSSSSNQPDLVSAIRKEILSIDKDQPVYSVRTIDELLLRSISQLRFYMTLLTIFAGIALVMAAVGIYGVLAYSVNQRKGEMGVRLALGAQRNDIIKMVLAQGMKLVLIGVVAGIAIAIPLTSLMSSLFYEVHSIDPLTYVGVSLFLAFIALISCYLPARSATRVDPAITLRGES